MSIDTCTRKSIYCSNI